MDNILLFRTIAIIFVIIETFSIIHGYLFDRLWIPTILLLCVALKLYPKSFLNWETFFMVNYTLTIIIFSFLGHPFADKNFIISNIFYPLSCLAIINVLLCNGDIRGLKIITVIGLFIMLMTSIATIPILLAFPNAVRSYVTFLEADNLEMINSFQRLGIANFGLVHSLAFVLPVLFYIYTNEKRIVIKLCVLVTIVIPFCMILLSNVTTALILSTIGIFSAFVLTIKRKQLVYPILFMFFFVAAFMGNDLIAMGLNSLRPIFVDTPNEEKIDDIIILLTAKSIEGDVGARSDLYKTSWNTFIDNPVLGSMDGSNIGGHSHIIDRLAAFGVIGVISYFMFLLCTFKRHYSLFDQKTRSYYLLGLGIFLYLAFLKNISGIETYLYLFVFLPGLCLISRDVLSFLKVEHSS